MQKIPALLINKFNGSFRASQASPSFRTESNDKQSISITYHTSMSMSKHLDFKH
jgi:hypothetical protein